MARYSGPSPWRTTEDIISIFHAAAIQRRLRSEKMKGIGRHLQNPTVAGRSLIFASSSFSTSSFGRGRGRGSGPGFDPSIDAPRTTFSPLPPPPSAQVTHNDESRSQPPPPPPSSGFGHGQGRGKPLGPPPPAAPVRPFVGSIGVNQSAGRGRGGASFLPRQQNPEQMRPASPPLSNELSEQILDQLRSNSVEVGGREEETEVKRVKANIVAPDSEIRPFSELKFTNVPSGGIGRGKVSKPSAPEAVSSGDTNRHVKVLKQQARDPTAPKLAPEEAVKKAMEILRMKSEAAGDVGRGRGRGRGRGMGIGRGRGRGRRDAEEDGEVEMYLGDDADGERLARRLGPEKMNQLNEVFDKVCGRVLPTPLGDAYEDALDTNYAIELEPEWHFGDLSFNPDIHDTPIIPLRDALEKMKPFIMAYENIQSQEEWEEVVEETMNKKLPIIQEIVDSYSGHDVITALQQQEELNRIADTLPKRSPASVKKFASNSILSLQSNPGWGSDKKMQFMDKLVKEVSQHYK